MAVRRGINHTQAKKRNLAYIKEIIYQNSPVSRGEIADMLTLTPATITNNVALLLESGLVHEIHSEDIPEDLSVGRRPIMLEFIADALYVIGVEISPRGIFLSLCNMRAEIIHESKFDGDFNNYKKTLYEVSMLVETSIIQSGISREKIAGIGVSAPGFIDRDTGYIRYGFSTEWENKNLVKDLHDLVKLEVCVDNNASVRAIADGLLEKNRPGTFAYLFVSKGIACPLMIQNSVLSRRVTGAGEIGHMVIDVHGRKCERCGNYGCLETFAGEDAIRQACADAIAGKAKTVLNEIAAEPELPTIKEIITAASKGDKVVNKILEDAVWYLVIGLCNIIKFISPEMVVIDAYIMVLDELRDKFVKYFKEYLSENKWNKVEIVFKPFNEFGGARGSAALAIKNFVLDK